MKRRLLGIVLCATASLAQTSRPKIGLVLEGGGALGLAHVGVLHWLEEHRIPVDYIAGTSMGALVGGLYATGRTAPDLEKFVSTIEWNQVLSGDVPYTDLIYRRKEDRRAYPTFIEFGWRNGLALPAGFSSGEHVSLLFDEVTLPYAALKSFDDLPIPFRCVSTELTSAKSEVFQDGSLAEALRATMAIPGFFTPVQRDGKVYADGGLLENLPVDVVRKMGADIVIAVHLQVKPYDPKDISSPIATLGRSISVVIAVNELRSMEKADVLITVPLQEYGSTEYNKSEDIIEKGRQAPEAKAALLSRLSVNEADYSAWRQRVDSRRIKQIPTPEFVEVQGTRPELAENIREELGEFRGKAINTAALDREMVKVTGIGRFSKIDYSVIQRDGKTGLLIKAEEKSHAPPTILPGILINGADFNNVQLTLGGRVTWLDVGSYRTEVRTDISVGSIYSAYAEYYRPLHPNSKWFIAPQAFAYDEPTSLFSEGDRIAEYRSRAAGGAIDFGMTNSRFSEFRVGYRLYHSSLVRQIGEPNLPNLSGSTGITSVRFVADKTDDAMVPRSGYYWRSRAEFWDKNIGATGGFPLAETFFSYFQPVSRPASLFFQASGGTTFGNDGVGLPVFGLGGIGRMGAYGTNEFRTNQYWHGRVGYLHEIGRLPMFAGRRIFALGAGEILKPYGQQTTRLAADLVGGVLLETLIGPIVFAGAFGESGHQKVYFQVGRYF